MGKLTCKFQVEKLRKWLKDNNHSYTELIFKMGVIRGKSFSSGIIFHWLNSIAVNCNAESLSLLAQATNTTMDYWYTEE